MLQVNSVTHYYAILSHIIISYLQNPVDDYLTSAPSSSKSFTAFSSRLVLPMHFRRGEQGFPELTTLEDFLSRLPEQPVHRLTEETLDLKSNRTSGIVIFPRR